jgi:DNA-binding XRE family transcriptional regulator
MDLRLFQREVGQRIGACVATVYVWEADRITPEVKWWPKILDFLGYDPQSVPKSVSERLVSYR